MSNNFFHNSRREFLEKSFYGLAGISAIPSFVGEKIPGKENTKEKNKTIYRTLGRTGIRVPVISLGGTRPELTRAALEAGITHLDTAHRYGAGRHEAMLGEIIKSKPRESLVVVTKIIPYLDNRTGLPSANITPAEFKKDFLKKMNQSLKRLQVDYVDILYLHGVETTKTLKNTLIKDIMLELKEQGKTRFIGTSFHHKELSLIRTTVDEKIYDVLLTSYNFRQPHREEVKKALAYAAQKGVGTVAMKVMAGAFWDKDRKSPINGKAALKWVLQDPNLHTTIPSPDTFEQLDEDLTVLKNLTLTPKERQDLRIGEKLSLAGLYCAQCGKCRSQCRYNLDIPTLMRSYMYAYGYKNPAKAKQTLTNTNPRKSICHTCADCTVQCTMDFNVKTKIKDIIRVLDIPDEFLV